LPWGDFLLPWGDTFPAQQGTDGGEHGPERGIRGNVEAGAGQHRKSPAGGQPRDLPRHGRLADAGIPADHKHLWLALHRLAQRRVDEPELVVAPDEHLQPGLARHPIILFAPSTRLRTEQPSPTLGAHPPAHTGTSRALSKAAAVSVWRKADEPGCGQALLSTRAPARQR
jgi:hypothetical protein